MDYYAEPKMNNTYWVKAIMEGPAGLPKGDQGKIFLENWKGVTPSWDGDNSKFVVEFVLPRLEALGRLRPDVKQVLRWAYGFDDSMRSFEKESNGSSVVRDVWAGGAIKEPYGVGHDMLFILHKAGLPTPDGHRWGWWEANLWYYRAMRDFGMGWRAPVRFTGLTIGSLPVWWSWFDA